MSGVQVSFYSEEELYSIGLKSFVNNQISFSPHPAAHDCSRKSVCVCTRGIPIDIARKATIKV